MTWPPSPNDGRQRSQDSNPGHLTPNPVSHQLTICQSCTGSPWFLTPRTCSGAFSFSAVLTGPELFDITAKQGLSTDLAGTPRAGLSRDQQMHLMAASGLIQPSDVELSLLKPSLGSRVDITHRMGGAGSGESNQSSTDDSLFCFEVSAWTCHLHLKNQVRFHSERWPHVFLEK